MICPANEHFNNLRGKCYAQIHDAAIPEDDSKVIVLYLPEREIHDIFVVCSSIVPSSWQKECPSVRACPLTICSSGGSPFESRFRHVLHDPPSEAQAQHTSTESLEHLKAVVSHFILRKVFRNANPLRV